MDISACFSNCGSVASIVGVGLWSISQAALKGIRGYVDLRKISEKQYQSPLKKELADILFSLANGGGPKANLLRNGLSRDVDVDFLDKLADPSILDDILSLCIAELSSDWKKYKRKQSAQLESIRNCCGGDRDDLSSEVFEEYMKAVMPLLSVSLFRELGAGDRAILNEFSLFGDKLEGVIGAIDSKLDFLCECKEKKQEYEFDADCIRCFAFVNSLLFLKRAHIREIMCEDTGIVDDFRYFYELDKFINDNDTNTILGLILKGVREISANRSSFLSDEILADARTLCFLILVLKSEFKESEILTHKDTNIFKCDYHDGKLRDLDAMLSPLLNKQFEPQGIKQYYYVFEDMPEAGFTRIGNKADACNAVFNSLYNVDFDTAKLNDEEIRKFNNFGKSADEVRMDKSPHYFFMVFPNSNSFDISKALSEVFPQVVFVNKSSGDGALKIIKKDEFSSLEESMAYFLGDE